MIIDVRTAEEYRRGNRPGSINIPLADIRRFHSSDKNTLIRVYCKSGSRSAQAKELLEEMGYTNVINLGGFDK